MAASLPVHEDRHPATPCRVVGFPCLTQGHRKLNISCICPDPGSTKRYRGHMGVQRLGRDTTSVDSLVWNGHGFDGTEAQSMWWQLPETLKQIAIAELQAGNIPEHILRNDT